MCILKLREYKRGFEIKGSFFYQGNRVELEKNKRIILIDLIILSKS